MAYTHADFKRLLPHLLKGYEYQINNNLVNASRNQCSVTIQLGPEYERRIASLAMPVCDVTLVLDGFDEAEAAAFLDHFDRTYRRGGG